MKTRRKPSQPLAKQSTALLIGYARVSTGDQNLRMQIEALEAAGVKKDNLYTDKASGRTMRRPGLQAALLDASPGDQFVVWRLDRLARNILDLIYLSKKFQEEGIHLRSLHENIDTTTPMGAFVFHILSALAEMESAQTGFRTKRGMDAAAREGRRFGPEPKFGDKEIKAAIDMFKAGKVDGKWKISAAAVGKHFGVSGQLVRDKVLAYTRGRRMWPKREKKLKS